MENLLIELLTNLFSVLIVGIIFYIIGRRKEEKEPESFDGTMMKFIGVGVSVIFGLSSILSFIAKTIELIKGLI